MNCLFVIEGKYTKTCTQCSILYVERGYILLQCEMRAGRYSAYSCALIEVSQIKLGTDNDIITSTLIEFEPHGSLHVAK